MEIASQKTVFCALDAETRTHWVEMLTLDNVSLTIDTGALMEPTRTLIVIDGVHYIPLGTSVEITGGAEGASVVTTVAVSAK